MPYAEWILLTCAVLFALRVIGQVNVALYAPRWLPAMEHWYSGLMPYRYLLPAQLFLLALMVLIVADVFRGDGFFVCRRLGIRGHASKACSSGVFLFHGCALRADHDL